MSVWKTPQDWAELKLAGLPETKSGLIRLAKRDGWQDLGPEFARKRSGRGGGWEYHLACLPAEARSDWERRQAAAEAETQIAERAKQEKAVIAEATDLRARQSRVMAARATVLREVDRRAFAARVSVRQAILSLVEDVDWDRMCIAEGRADQRRIDPELFDAATEANDRGSGLSRSQVYAWMQAFHSGGITALAPKISRQKEPLPDWLAGFLRHFARPQNPTMAHALDLWREAPDAPEVLPSYDQVRRAMKALKASDRFLDAYKGREGPLALKARLLFTRRTLEGMEPTIIYTADGKTFDAEIAHPIHGQPFRPEITTIVDVVSRRIVGWSVDLAENSRAVSDALRHACVTNGIPAVFYTDRGPGYRNKELDHETLGLCARLGITTTHSLPYNSQARGLMERINGSVWNRVAKELPTYLGPDMDREAKQLVHKQTRRERKEFGTSRTLPSFDDFLALMDKRVATYNDTLHSSLKIKDPASGRMRRASPNEVWADFEARGFESFPVTQAEADDLFRPHVKRRVARGEVNWIGNQYAHEALERYHGSDVLVGYDIHDGTKVWVRELEMLDGKQMPGRLICVAEFWHNKERYMPVAFTDHAKEKRVEGQLKRLNEKRERVLDDLRAAELIEAPKEGPLPPVETARADPEPVVVELTRPAKPQYNRDPRNPYDDPDLWLAWQIVDLPADAPIPEGHVKIMKEVIEFPVFRNWMREVQLPVAVLEDRLRAATEAQIVQLRKED